MNVIEICLVEPRTKAQRQLVVKRALENLLQFEIKNLEFDADKSGKPRFNVVGGPAMFYSFSNAHKSDPPFGIAAISLDHEIGIDIEMWPHKQTDNDFLESISSEEDAATLAILNRARHDSGIALWVIKEAALKCGGEVMIDPRHLAVTYEGHGVFFVCSSAKARAPHPETRVQLGVLAGAHLPDAQFVFAVAVPAYCDLRKLNMQLVYADRQRWRIEGFESSYSI